MTRPTLRVLSFGLIAAILLGLWTIFLTPGSTVTKKDAKIDGLFITQSHKSASEGMYVPFDPRYGLQGRQRSSGKREQINQ